MTSPNHYNPRCFIIFLMLKYWRQIEYREAGSGLNTILLFHGGHMRAASDSGESVFVENDYRVLIPSRPGYGKTPLSAGKKAADFADTMAEFLLDLNVKSVTIVGISGGGPTALQFAQRHPKLVNALILQSAVGHDGWPDTNTHRLAHIGFNSVTEKITWAIIHTSFTLFPQATLKFMLRSLSTKSPNDALQTIRGQQRTSLINILKQLRSGHGFINDIHYTVGELKGIIAPTLIIHSKYDGSVDLSHPQFLADHISNNTLLISEAENHMFWYSDYYSEIKIEMMRFLDSLRYTNV
ncbi:MAG: alpha/beta hydrolase [Chloroflexi bacterium]|nr:alpha/beta hydrolase [Chloroflexota bacterium]